MISIDSPQVNKALRGLGKLKAKIEVGLLGGKKGDRISVGKAKSIAAKYSGDPTMAQRTSVTMTGRDSGHLPGMGPGSHYNPGTDSIQTSPFAPVAAHEGIHARQARLVKDLAKKAGISDTELVPTAVFGGANTSAQIASQIAGMKGGTPAGRAIGAGVGHIPRLVLEGDATIRGTITQPGGWRAAAGSFGSYAGGAANDIRKALKKRELSSMNSIDHTIQLNAKVNRLIELQGGYYEDEESHLMRNTGIGVGAVGAGYGAIKARGAIINRHGTTDNYGNRVARPGMYRAAASEAYHRAPEMAGRTGAYARGIGSSVKDAASDYSGLRQSAAAAGGSVSRTGAAKEALMGLFRKVKGMRFDSNEKIIELGAKVDQMVRL